MGERGSSEMARRLCPNPPNEGEASMGLMMSRRRLAAAKTKAQLRPEPQAEPENTVEPAPKKRGRKPKAAKGVVNGVHDNRKE